MSSAIHANTLDRRSAPNPGWREFDQLFHDAIGRGLLSGGVALAWHKGAVVHAAAMGWRDIARDDPMRMDAIFRLYSMPTPVVAVAMMILWDEGRWSPTDPIAKYLPELADLQVMVGTDETGAPILAPPSTPPTMEHLMTHQTGFSYGFAEDAIDRAFRAAGVPVLPCDLSAEAYLKRLAQVPLAFEPGTGWRYGVSMDVQGIIVERLSGMGLRDFMRQRIFAPLEMVDTDFLVPAEKRDRLATLYAIEADTLVELTADTPSFTYENMAKLAPRDIVLSYDRVPMLPSGGGGLVSTAADYLRLGRMLLGRGSIDGIRLLSPEAVATMTRSHTPHLLAGRFGTPPHELRPGYEFAYNGVAVTDPVAAGVSLGQGTYFWDGAAGCWFWVDPENETVLVALVQLLTDAEKLSLQFRSRDIVADIIANSSNSQNLPAA